MSSMPGQVKKFPFFIARAHVVMAGLPAQACKNCASSVFVLSLRIMALTLGEDHFLTGLFALFALLEIVGTGMSHNPSD
jgi:hypothetical protein